MAIYSLLVPDGTLTIDGVTATGIDYAGIDPTINSVQWYETVGTIDYKWDPVTGFKPLNAEITSITPYQTYITQAENFIYAKENPVTFWALEDTLYDDNIYEAGAPLYIYTYPQPTTPPAGFTDVQPIGAASVYDTWQFNGTSWIAAPFPISLDLAGAQDYLTKLVQANAAILLNNQLSSYDAAQIAEAADPELLEPRYKAVNLYPTIGDYRAAVALETAPQFAAINAATAVNQLYNFDPTVDEPPNYVAP